MQTQRLRIVSGKGGVGKTTVAIALALAEVQAGARVLLVELNGRDRIAALLGVEPVGYNLREVFQNLWVVDVNARDATQEYILLTLRFETLYRALFENRLVTSFLRLLPALGELTMLGKIWYHAEQVQHGRPRFDVIVVDAPATGHARALFAAPQAVAASVPPGPMRKNAENLHAMLTDAAHTQLHVVTTPEDMPVTEALEICTAAQQLGITLGPAIVNQALPALPSGTLTTLAAWDADPLWAGVPAALRRREARAQFGARQLQRLPAEVMQGAIVLPRLIDPLLTRAAVETLARAFAPWMHSSRAPSGPDTPTPQGHPPSAAERL